MRGNLNDRGVQERYLLAVVGLLAGVLLTALAMSGRLPGSWKALIFIPFMLSALGFFQAREKT